MEGSIILAVSDPPREVSATLPGAGALYRCFSSFQHAVIRNLNDKQAQLQKQLDNVVREGDAHHEFDSVHSQLLANGEINLLGNKVAGMANRAVSQNNTSFHCLRTGTRPGIGTAKGS
jgi:hypothetical protein